MAANQLALVEAVAESPSSGPPVYVNKYTYPEFAGPAGEEALNAICQQILPNALWRTWRAMVAFQPPGKPCFVSADRVAEATKPGVRKIYLDLQKLEDHHLLQTTAFMYRKTLDDGTVMERPVTAKNFDGLYDLAHEYYLWMNSPSGRSLPPIRESAEFIRAQPELMKKLLRYDNYRRLLMCQKPGRKRKLQEDDVWDTAASTGQKDDLTSETMPAASAPKVNLYLNVSSFEDSPKRISNDTPSNDPFKNSFDSELPRRKEEVLAQPSAYSQTRACSAGDYTKEERATNEATETLSPPQTNPTNPSLPSVPIPAAKQASKRESAEMKPAVHLAQQVMALAQGQGRPGSGATGRYGGDGKPRPLPNAMVSSFIGEIASVFGDKNPKGSITLALRASQQCRLSDNTVILACLVHAYTVARDTRKVRKEHVSEDGSANKMPLFLAMFKRFAGACASGKSQYTHDDLVAAIAGDERLCLWLMEHSDELQMRRDPASLSQDALAVAAATPQDEAEDVASASEEPQPAQTAVLPQEDLAAGADHGQDGEAPAQTEHPESGVSVKRRVIHVDDPAVGWRRYDSAQHWAERLREHLGSTVYDYKVLPTEHGCWGFALFERRDRANEQLFVTADEVKPYLARERRS